MTSPTNPTSPTPEPGERRALLDRAPSERYAMRPSGAPPDNRREPLERLLVILAIILGGAIGFVLLGSLFAATSGLLILAAFVGWLIGRVVSPPWRAGLVGLAMVAFGLLGIWLFARFQGGVLDPIAYFGEVHGVVLIALQFLLGGGLAAASSR